ncbi:hypothetical protein OPV22_020533 [Ensete ventricosum]|uniref:Uncharacterized protein n=1 Tax=Ensete ventricosum TaxID=4639 RepID=A0AAV8PC46_ENSVE|nr:hypothetical protein OPV22_020533 [Ensete ventricosum]
MWEYLASPICSYSKLFLVTNEICRLLNNLAKGAPETLLDTVHSQEKQRSSPLPWGKTTCILFLLALTLLLLLLSPSLVFSASDSCGSSPTAFNGDRG